MRGRAILRSGLEAASAARATRRVMHAIVTLVLALACASSIAVAQTPSEADPPASTQPASTYFRGAGDDQDSWFALPAGRLGWTLHHVPAEAPPGTVRRVGLMSQRPALMAAGDARLIMMFEPGAETTSRERGPWVVRELRVTRLAAGRGAGPLTTYSEPAPLMPLPATATPIALAFDGVIPHALCTIDGPKGSTPKLLAFWRGAWSERALPVEGARASDLTLLTMWRRLAVVQRAPGGAGGGAAGGAAESAVLWLLKPGVSTQAIGERTSEEPAWDRGPLGAFDGVMAAGGQVLRVEATQPDGWRVSLVRAAGVVPIAEVGEISPRVDAPEGAPWIVPVGDGVGMFWGDEEWSKRRDQPRGQRGVGDAPTGGAGATASAAEPAPVPMYATRVYARVIASGQVLHDGPAKLATPVGSGEFEALGLALLSLVAAVSAFVFRRDRDRDGVVRLPEGASLASGNRRIAATMIDVALATLIAAWAWSVPVLDVLLITGVGVSEAGLKPTASALAVLFVTSAACEALCGRTLGKLVMGTRTISAATGRNPGWGQAIGRSAVKALCPPLAAFYVSPAQPDQAGLFGTLVISGPPRPDAEQN